MEKHNLYQGTLSPDPPVHGAGHPLLLLDDDDEVQCVAVHCGHHRPCGWICSIWMEAKRVNYNE